MRHAVAALALAILLCTACSGPEAPPPSSIQALDRTHVLAVEANLKTDVELAGAGIRVSAKNDAVVLQGQVPSEDAKRRAEGLALKTRGIRKVDNQLQVVAP